MEIVDLVSLVREAVAHVSSEQHTCAVEGEEPITGAFDRARILQLLDNLLENALKYSPSGGRLVVRVRAVGRDACIEVQDEGIGIPADDLPHLFDRFHRGSNVDRVEATGLGLGLYICKGIVEEHGGRIWATSPGIGAGSTFYIKMPIRPLPGGEDLEMSPVVVGDLAGT
jgi:signal transduction histidine kinase